MNSDQKSFFLSTVPLESFVIFLLVRNGEEIGQFRGSGGGEVGGCKFVSECNPFCKPVEDGPSQWFLGACV